MTETQGDMAVRLGEYVAWLEEQRVEASGNAKRFFDEGNRETYSFQSKSSAYVNAINRIYEKFPELRR